MDILFSIFLLVFAGYCFFLVGAESPAGVPTELGAAFWPRIILVLMIVLLIVNLLNAIKKMKADGTKLTHGINIGQFFRSKLFVGMVIVAIMAAIMPLVGFIPSCLFLLIAYGFLLGERRIKFLIPVSLVITLVLYVLFQGALDIMLDRGVSVFREFALVCEGILPF